MFRHIFIYRFKCIIGDKAVVFWSMVFPLILATFFSLSISNITEGEVVKSIAIAIVKASDEETSVFEEMLESVELEGKAFFEITHTDEEEAQQLLGSKLVDGIIEIEEAPVLTVRKRGIKESIIKSYIDGFMQKQKMIEEMMIKNKELNIDEVLTILQTHKDYTEEVTIGKNKPDMTLNYFYSLIGMAGLYGSFLGMKEIVAIQGNLSKQAARLNMVPVAKVKQFLAGYLAAYCIQIVGGVVLFGYLIAVLKIEFGAELALIVLALLVSSAMGVALGGFVGCIGRMNENIKMSILTGITLVGSALSGMMYSDLRYIIGKELPLLMYINPVALITNSFYALYYYEGYTEYVLNISLMLCFTIVFIIGAYRMVRRKQYVSL